MTSGCPDHSGHTTHGESALPRPQTAQGSTTRRAPRIACIGGGPGGLFFAIALARNMPEVTVDVFERNNASDVFGFGVVFSDRTIDNINAVDPVLQDALDNHGRHWDTIEVRIKGQTIAAGGNGMSAVHRRVLLDELRERATALGARLHFASPVTVDQLDAQGDYDLIIAADGANSATRQQFLDDLNHRVDQAAVKFIWFATDYQFEGLTFLHEQSVHGNFAVHAYPIGSGLSTFIVETDETTWRRAGLDGFDTSAPAGPSDLVTQRYLEELFADSICGHKLVANNSRWANFRTRRTGKWHTHTRRGTPVVFLGDAVHTAHFSVGSGTKMAMEDAAVLAATIAEHGLDGEEALVKFEAIRRPEVDKIQDSATPSLSWWDHFAHYYRALRPWQFGFHFFSRAISAERIRVRDPHFFEAMMHAWKAEHGASPIDTPLSISTTALRCRLLTVIDNTNHQVQITDGKAVLVFAEGDRTLPLIHAPSINGTTLDAITRAELDTICAEWPSVVAVHLGTELTRVLCSEYIRFTYNIPTIVIDDPTSVRARRAVDEDDAALTLILSGRADAVAYPAYHCTAGPAASRPRSGTDR